MTPDKPGWWRLKTLWCGEESDYEREFIVEVEEIGGELRYWLPHLDYTEPVERMQGEWLGEVKHE